MDSAQPIGIREQLAYALPALVLALLGITFYVYLPKFYVDSIGVDLSVLGFIIISSRIFDALSDPLIGALSDRTRSRFGRRRPWMLGALLPLGASFFLLLRPDLAPSWCSAEVWLGILSFIFFLSWTMVSIPYEALGTALSFVYDERTKILALRDGALVLGTLLAVVIPQAIAGRTGDAATAHVLTSLAVAYPLLTCVAIVLCIWLVHERSGVDTPKEISLAETAKALRSVVSNRPFLVLLTAYVIAGFGAALPATLIAFYVEQVLGSKAWGQFLVLYFLIGFLVLPGWVWLARRIEKHQTWLIAMIVNTGAFIGVFFLGPGQLTAYGVLVAISSLGYGATLALPSSMQADVIDLDELQNGTRREGQFVGIWSVAKKLAAALGAGIAFPILDQLGYVPGATSQSPEVITALRWLYAGVPCVCNIIAILVVTRYSITRVRHAQIRAQILARSN